MQRIGRELADSLPRRSRHPVKAIDDRAMELASRDAELRAALFRLVDVTPACRSLDDLARHLDEYLAQVDERTPTLSAAMRAADSRAGRKALGAAAAAGVRHMAHRFIVGESPEDALKTLRALHDDGVLTTVDLLGEATVSSAEADRYAERCGGALQTLADAMASWPGRPAAEPVGEGVRAHAGAAARGARPRPRRRRRAAASAARAGARPRRPPARGHGVARLARDDARPGLRAARRGRVPGTARRPGSCSRRTCATRRTSSTGSSTGRAAPSAHRRSPSGSSRARTGTTR